MGACSQKQILQARPQVTILPGVTILRQLWRENYIRRGYKATCRTVLAEGEHALTKEQFWMGERERISIGTEMAIRAINRCRERHLPINVIEIGCGYGGHTLLPGNLAAYVLQNQGSYYAFDFVRWAVTLTRRRSKTWLSKLGIPYKDLHVIEADDREAISWLDDKQVKPTVALIFFVIQHSNWTSTVQLLNDLKSRMPPGSTIVLLFPAREDNSMTANGVQQFNPKRTRLHLKKKVISAMRPWEVIEDQKLAIFGKQIDPKSTIEPEHGTWLSFINPG